MKTSVRLFADAGKTLESKWRGGWGWVEGGGRVGGSGMKAKLYLQKQKRN